MRCVCLEFKPYSVHGTLPFSISIPSAIRFLEYMTASTFFALYAQFVFCFFFFLKQKTQNTIHKYFSMSLST